MRDIECFLSSLVTCPNAYIGTKRLKARIKVTSLFNGTAIINFPYNERLVISSYKRYAVLFENGYVELLSESEFHTRLTNSQGTAFSNDELRQIVNGEWVRGSYTNDTRYLAMRIPLPLRDLRLTNVLGVINPSRIEIPTTQPSVIIGAPINKKGIRGNTYSDPYEETYLVTEYFGNSSTGVEIKTYPASLFDGLFNKTAFQTAWDLTTATVLSTACLLDSLEKNYADKLNLLHFDAITSTKDKSFYTTLLMTVTGNEKEVFQVSHRQEGIKFVTSLQIGNNKHKYAFEASAHDAESYARLKQSITKTVNACMGLLVNANYGTEPSDKTKKLKLSNLYGAIYEAFKLLPGEAQARLKADANKSGTGNDLLLIQHKHARLVQPVLLQFSYDSVKEELNCNMEVGDHTNEKLQPIHISYSIIDDTNKLRLIIGTLQTQVTREYVRAINEVIDVLGKSPKAIYGSGSRIAVAKGSTAKVTAWKELLTENITKEIETKFNGSVKHKNVKGDIVFTVNDITALVLRYTKSGVSVLNKSNTVHVTVKEPTAGFISNLAQNCANFCIL